ncbi:MAG: hypothetical protein EXR21_08270 [Flavobacteriaceae bacterium]|nr:hypothetical protein [Flavobacteriaceae bacterium]
MNLKKVTILLLSSTSLATFSSQVIAQTSTLPAIKISGFADVYYAAFNDSVGAGNFQKWPSISSRSHQFGLNTIQLTAQYDGDKFRAISTIHFGDIAKSTWDGTYNPIMEAHAGVKLSKKWWLDAGFFRTHVGTEGLLPKENITSSVAVATFHEPYYQSGARFNFKPNSKLELNIFLLNGYNIYIDNNKKKSVGVLLNYTINDKAAFGYSNYLGDDAADGATAQMRVYQNAFFNYDAKKFKLQIGGDFGMQNKSDFRDTNNVKTASMFSGVVTGKYKIKKVHGVYARFEIFHDPTGFLCTKYPDNMGKQGGYSLTGLTLGGEYKPNDNSYIRLETRQIQMGNNQLLFTTNGKASSTRMELLINFGISF